MKKSIFAKILLLSLILCGCQSNPTEELKLSIIYKDVQLTNLVVGMTVTNNFDKPKTIKVLISEVTLENKITVPLERPYEIKYFIVSKETLVLRLTQRLVMSKVLSVKLVLYNATDDTEMNETIKIR